MPNPLLPAVDDVMRHVFVYSAAFLFFVSAAVYGSVITALASHAITSRFVFHVLVVLEYAIVVGDAVLILLHLVRSVRDSFKRIIR